MSLFSREQLVDSSTFHVELPTFQRIVMPGLEPGIHALSSGGLAIKLWMAGSSPAMTD
ncbi:MAG: hypothetical protein HQL44_02485 [Alphaproteobacteria bacterium]|nr:hypothetical protein [Alphaproteobacteria bacterium]